MSRYIDADALKKSIDDCDICNICPDKDVRCDYDCDFPDCLTPKWETLIDSAPSIDLDTDVWCEDCKEYDKEHHNCPRFNRVIRTALEDAGMVSVVRCEDCRKSHIDGKTTHYLWCTEWGRSTDTFGYCERGEREGE